jgi:hypothetical protein
MRRLRLIVNITCNAFHFVKLKSVNGLAFTNNRKLNRNNGRNRQFYFSWTVLLTSYWMVAHSLFDVVSIAKTILHRSLWEEDLIVLILNLKNLSVFWPQSVDEKENHINPEVLMSLPVAVRSSYVPERIQKFFPFQKTLLVFIPYYLPIFF